MKKKNNKTKSPGTPGHIFTVLSMDHDTCYVEPVCFSAKETYVDAFRQLTAAAFISATRDEMHVSINRGDVVQLARKRDTAALKKLTIFTAVTDKINNRIEVEIGPAASQLDKTAIAAAIAEFRRTPR
jgi:hypothetical protein